MSSDPLIQTALAHHQKGQLVQAAALYRRVLSREPENFLVLQLLGVVCGQQGQPEEGIALLEAALKINPRDIGALSNLGPLLVAVGRLDQAVASYDKALTIKPAFFEALYNRGTALAQLNRNAEALASYDAALRLQNNAMAWYNRGLTLMALVRLEHALESYDRAIALNPSFAAAHDNRGNVLRRLGRPEEALAAYDQALKRAPQDFRAWYNRGVLLSEMRRPVDALASHDRALAAHGSFAPAWAAKGAVQLALARYGEAALSLEKALNLNREDPETLHNRGVALWHLRHYDQAIASYNESLRLRPDHAPTFFNRGLLYQEVGRLSEALADFDRAVMLTPGDARAWNARGAAQHGLRQGREALASFDRAVALDPALAEALGNRGLLRWSEEQNFQGARDDLERALALDPNRPYLEGELLHIKMYAADWDGYDQARATLVKGVREGRKVVRPFVYQAVSESPQDLLACARIFEKGLGLIRSTAPSLSPPHGKIRIGYLSGEFREQATAYLMAGLYERHDRARFEIVAIDSAGGDASPMRRRLEGAFNRFLYISGLNDKDAAQAIRDAGIDILVNLNGYFGAARMGVFARRAAPLQVNYLGFPGTLGADYMDYIFADREVIPQSERDFYAEKTVWLPHCYQANDDRRVAAVPTPSRAAAGLPETGFVFCNFNQSYKLTPNTFASWLRILARAPGSVLWLLDGPAPFADHLRAAAKDYGIARERLIFAPNLPPTQHLARLALAQLFLDSLPYNAHTTASDALWAGVPLLTRAGETFPGRVAASILKAAGLPQLIAGDAAGFEDRAVQLASDPEDWKMLKEILTDNRPTCPLFDTDLFRLNIEQAYSMIYERHRQGLPAEGFAV
jgi:predicted O-linked N-acetylglucosamine transferase (SPINDLY family)